jgi:DNA ligase-1
MLAHPTKSITEVLNRFENLPFTCEFKYDGERAQIHKLDDGKTMMIFSRNQENMSQKYPDIMENLDLVPKENVSSFVLDCEAVAWDRENKHILPFQVLSTRKRKVYMCMPFGSHLHTTHCMYGYSGCFDGEYHRSSLRLCV